MGECETLQERWEEGEEGLDRKASAVLATMVVRSVFTVCLLSVVDAALMQTSDVVPQHNSSNNIDINASRHEILSFSNKTEALKKEKDVLTHLFGRLKMDIGRINKHETEQKAMSKKHVQDVQARLNKTQHALELHNLSAHEREQLMNESSFEEGELRYWKQDRDLQHNIFHANLKVSHGLMSKVKKVIGAYKEVLETGHLSKEAREKLHEDSLH